MGVRFYNGIATPGEHVILKREPQNQYDRNAIRIDNIMGIQIGHIGRGVAAKLAPYMVCSTIHPLRFWNSAYNFHRTLKTST